MTMDSTRTPDSVWVCEGCQGRGEAYDEELGWDTCPDCEGDGFVQSRTRPGDTLLATMRYAAWAEACRSMGIDPETGEDLDEECMTAAGIIRRYIRQSSDGPRPTMLQSRQALAALAILTSQAEERRS